MSCDAELCERWTGQGCICAVLGLERSETEEDAEDEEEHCCEDWDELSSHYHCARCNELVGMMGHIFQHTVDGMKGEWHICCPGDCELQAGAAV